MNNTTAQHFAINAQHVKPVYELVNAGHTVREIANRLALPTETVHQLVHYKP